MRLLTRTTLYFLLVMIPLLCADGYLLFWQFSLEINERADKELVYEEVQWIHYLEAATANGGNFILRSPDLLIFPTGDPPTRHADIVTIQGNRARERKKVPYRQLSHVVEINSVT